MDCWEFDLMKKFYRGAKIEPSEKLSIERLMSVGLLRKGYYKRKDGVYCETAKPTSLGYKAYNRERIRRSPVLRFLHGMVHGV